MLMGAACCLGPDNLQPLKGGTAPKAASHRHESPDRKSHLHTVDPQTLHDGQHRANLHVKDGGFALKNFMPTNAGKLESLFDLETAIIGEGGFGSVRKGKDKRTGRMCAVKSIRKTAAAQTKRLNEEIEIMRILDHPNIVRFLESFEDNRTIYICLELCEGGELFERICQSGHFSEVTASRCIRQMMLAINYLHQNFLMHRDLKPENWLLATREKVCQASLKLIDFGLSKRFQPGEYHRTKAGTPHYIAPEVLSGRYDEKVDIWSLGVICYMMLSGRQLFSGKTVAAVLRAVKTANVVMEPEYWKGVSVPAKGFVKACVQKSPNLRLSAALALSHEWFSIASDEGESMTALELSGLKAFGRMNQLKRAACTVIASQLSHADIGKLKSMFMTMDANGDGTLAAKEIKEGLRKMNVKLPYDLEELLEEVDTDGSGVIDYTEFLAATMDKKLCKQEQVVWKAFKAFDLNGSGGIDKKEMAMVLGEPEVVNAMHLPGQQNRLLEMFAEVDTNGDGMIDFDEFFAMMRQAEDGNAPVARTVAKSDFGEDSLASPRRSPGRLTADQSPRGRAADRKQTSLGLAATGWEYKKTTSTAEEELEP